MNFSNSLKRLLSLVILLVFRTGLGEAQDYRGKVQGVVTDSSAASAPGAKLTLRNVNAGTESTQVSNTQGQYVFNFVEPGTYSVSAELRGFNKFSQGNIQVQTRADVTVNVTLNPGSVNETVNVTADAIPSLQFNTSTMELTVDRKMLMDLPVLGRNPFTLALLDPAVVSRQSVAEGSNPFAMWSSSRLDVGGSTSLQNDLLLDGAPLQFSNKGGYAPPMDAVQEFSVQQNSVNAEFGHSAGGILSLSMKSGTNDLHGTAYYFGRNPALNAVSNSVTHTPNAEHNHIWGGTAGGAIIKDKLFTFGAIEFWRINSPRDKLMTLPTASERTGDFSRSLNTTGGLRTIYDPWTTVLNSATNTASRTPFVGNLVPLSRQDRTARRFMEDIWQPNGPGDDLTGINNFKTSYSVFAHYWNFSNRTDWNINSKWKLYARYSEFRTDQGQKNYGNSPALNWENQGAMNNRNVAGDVLYTINSTTVLNLRGSYGRLIDDFAPEGAPIQESLLTQFWPGNPWYAPYLKDLPNIYYPNLIIGGSQFGKGQIYWQHPHNFSESASLSKNLGRHNIKIGGESRQRRGQAFRPNLMGLRFTPDLTADTYLAPNTKLRGHEWATFLLGAMGSDSQAQYVPRQSPIFDFYAAYLQDDFKLNRMFTLNLGLRYELETPPRDPQYRLSRGLDLAAPNTAMQASPPKFPANVLSIRSAAPVYNGAWSFTDSDRPGMWNAAKHTFMPRIGLAIKVNDKTAIRFGFARYVIPPLLTVDTLGSLQYPGFNATSTVAPVLVGVPGALLSDPFPSANPLILPIGKTRGAYTNVGDAALWYPLDTKTGVNDRINLTVQRALPAHFHVDVTYFTNFGRNLPYTDLVNLTNPEYSYTYKAALTQQVSNPFYQYLTPAQFPGALRNQATVSIATLLAPYPQYGTLSQANTPGVLNRYHALQLKLQRQFSNGLSLLMGYNFNREWTSNFFNTDDQYTRTFTFLNSNNPRHRMNLSGTYEFPFGRGRRLLAHAPAIVNAILGGWSTSNLFNYSSGVFLRFGPLQVTGDPHIDHPSRTEAFNTAAFQILPAFTKRTNPWQYEGLTGPHLLNLDSTLSKLFQIRERLKLEVKAEAYNVTNSFNPTSPDVSVTSSTFGRSTNQANLGRGMQYTLRLIF